MGAVMTPAPAMARERRFYVPSSGENSSPALTRFLAGKSGPGWKVLAGKGSQGRIFLPWLPFKTFQPGTGPEPGQEKNFSPELGT